nr:reverse transcriptase domain-containing protein [Tanacetum cinerariifolium]
MSTNEQTPLSQPTSAVRNTLGREQAPQNLVRPVPDEDLREYCDKNYHQILPIIAEKLHQEKVQQEKLKAVKARLNFEEASQYSESETPNRRRNLKERLGPKGARTRSISPKQRRGHSKSPKEKGPERRTVFKRLEKGVFHRLGDKEKNVSTHSRESESEGSAGGQWKSKPKKQKSSMENDLSQPWSIDEMMSVTIAFLRGEMAASNRERKKSFPSWKQETRQKQNFKRGNFRNEQRLERKQDRFTLLTKTPREILALDKGKFKPPPSRTTLVKKGMPASSRNNMASGADIVASKDKRRGTINIHSDEFHGAHGMIKFPVVGGIVALQSSRIIPLECSMVSEPKVWRPSINQVKEEKIQVAIHPEYPEQTKPTDMTRVPRHIAEHRLNVHEGCLPVRQKKRGQTPERNKAISKEVRKLVEAGIMKEVHYHSWLSNPVMVKKHYDSWRMCVDFKDLNKVCPKDGYPLPEIDWKVESLCGYPYKCFLDAYKGYHQIKMAEEDEEKTAFITSQGIFWYSKMPFGLKNAGATYQRLVDKAFQKQIG